MKKFFWYLSLGFFFIMPQIVHGEAWQSGQNNIITLNTIPGDRSPNPQTNDNPVNDAGYSTGASNPGSHSPTPNEAVRDPNSPPLPSTKTDYGK